MKSKTIVHGGANADEFFGVMDTITICAELISELRSARAAVCVKALANDIKVADTRDDYLGKLPFVLP